MVGAVSALVYPKGPCQAVYVRQRQLLSVIKICCLLKNVSVCHRQSVFVTDSVRLLQKVIICQSESNTLLIFLGLIFTYLYGILIKICLWDISLSRISESTKTTLWTPAPPPIPLPLACFATSGQGKRATISWEDQPFKGEYVALSDPGCMKFQH